MEECTSYKIIFKGALREGCYLQESIEALSIIFNLKLLELERLLERAPCVVKTCTAEKVAKQYVKRLWQAGWHSEVNRGDRVIYRTEEANKESSSVSPSIVQKEVESLVFPSSWCELTGLNSNASVQAGCQSENSYCIVIPQEFNRGIKADLGHLDYAKAVVNTACKSLGDFYLEEFCRPVTIDRSDYRTYLSELRTCKQDGQGAGSELYYMIGVFEGRDKFYSVYLWSNSNAYDQIRPTFLSIIESFDLVEKAYHQAA
jgi:hypothetical protein